MEDREQGTQQNPSPQPEKRPFPSSECSERNSNDLYVPSSSSELAVFI
jgi:hypothetical protein